MTLRPQLARIVLAALIVLVLISVPGDALAQDGTPIAGRILPSCTYDAAKNCNLDDFVAAFVNLANFFLGFAGFIAIFYFIQGSFLLIISSGNSDRIEAGKKTLLGAIVGVFIVFAAWTVINTLYTMLVGEGGAPFGREWFRIKDPGLKSSYIVPHPHEISHDVALVDSMIYKTRKP